MSQARVPIAAAASSRATVSGCQSGLAPCPARPSHAHRCARGGAPVNSALQVQCASWRSRASKLRHAALRWILTGASTQPKEVPMELWPPGGAWRPAVARGRLLGTETGVDAGLLSSCARVPATPGSPSSKLHRNLDASILQNDTSSHGGVELTGRGSARGLVVQQVRVVDGHSGRHRGCFEYHKPREPTFDLFFCFVLGSIPLLRAFASPTRHAERANCMIHVQHRMFSMHVSLNSPTHTRSFGLPNAATEGWSRSSTRACRRRPARCQSQAARSVRSSLMRAAAAETEPSSAERTVTTRDSISASSSCCCATRRTCQ